MRRRNRERDCKALAHKIMIAGKTSMIFLQASDTRKPAVHVDMSSARKQRFIFQPPLKARKAGASL